MEYTVEISVCDALSCVLLSCCKLVFFGDNGA